MSQPGAANHPPEEVLAAYALRLGPVDQAFIEHIEQCEICAHEIAPMISLCSALKEKLFRFDCPSEEKLTRFAFRELPIWERSAIEAHIQHCRHCTEEVHVLEQANSDILASPFSTLWETTRRLTATLLPQLPQYGFRDLEEAGELSPTLYAFAVDEVTVRLSRSKGMQGTFFLTGMLEPPSGLAVRLLQDTEGQPPALISEVVIETDGFFDLGSVSPGTYRLEVLFPDRLIEIGSLHL